MNAQPYEWTVEFFNKYFLPAYIKHLDEQGELLDTNHKPLPQRSETPYSPTKVGVIVHDGPIILNAAAEMLTHEKKLRGHRRISNSEEWSDFLKEDHPPDQTYFFNGLGGSLGGTMAYSPGKLINYGEGVPVDQLLREGLPQGFNRDGGKTLAALVTTYKFKGTSAVVIRTSLEGVSGSVLNFKDGALTEGAFAYKDGNLIKTVSIIYEQRPKHVIPVSGKVIQSIPFPRSLEEKVGENYGPRQKYIVREMPQNSSYN